MGTVFDLFADESDLGIEAINAAFEHACNELHELDDRFSTYKPHSELSRFRCGEIDSPSALLDEVIELSSRACGMSRGYFDPWAMPGGFDPTGLVKGWAIDRVAKIFRSFGITIGAVNGGGDIAVINPVGQKVGVQHPLDRVAMCGVVWVESAIATSGLYERGNHLRNPFGGDVAAISATVVGAELVFCDVMATALAVGGKEVLYLLEQVNDTEGFFIDGHGSMYKTSGMSFCDP